MPLEGPQIRTAGTGLNLAKSLVCLFLQVWLELLLQKSSELPNFECLGAINCFFSGMFFHRRHNCASVFLAYSRCPSPGLCKSTSRWQKAGTAESLQGQPPGRIFISPACRGLNQQDLPSKCPDSMIYFSISCLDTTTVHVADKIPVLAGLWRFKRSWGASFKAPGK